MALETGTYANDLVITNPTATDPKSQGDDHIRLLKKVIKNTLPGFTGAAIVTGTESGAANAYVLTPATALVAYTAPMLCAFIPTASNTGASTINISSLGVKSIKTQAGLDPIAGTLSAGVPTLLSYNGTTFTIIGITSAELTAAVFAATLPSQTGNAGKTIYTNGTSAYWSNAIGSGGTTASGNVTLTSSSDGAQSVTPSAFGQYVTLPDATTMLTESSVLFAIANTGDYDLGIKNSAGTQLGWIKPRQTALIGLASNATAAGVWTLANVEKVGMTAEFLNTSLAAGSMLQIVTVDANRTFFLILATNLYGLIYDASTLTWGSVTLIRSTVSKAACCLSTTNQILVASCSSTTAFEAVTLTLSSTTITPNTAATATLGGNINAMNTQSISGDVGLVAVGSTFICSYGRATNVTALRGMTISGTTVTIGSELALTPTVATASQIFSVNSTTGLAVNGDATNVHAMPFTVSGATVSAGTNATTAGTSTANKCVPFGSGNFAVFYNNTTLYGGVIKLTGSVAAISALSLINQSISSPSTALEVSVVSTTKMLATYGSTTQYANILTDTSGTASAGTQISFLSTGSINTRLIISGNTVRTGNGAYQYVFDCSGSSPVLSKYEGDDGGTPVAGSTSSPYGYRSYQTMYNGDIAVTISTSANYAKAIYTPTGTYLQIGTSRANSSSNFNNVGTSTNDVYYGVLGASTTVIRKLESAQ